MTVPPARWPELRRHLLNAQQHIPLYREAWARAGVDVRTFRDPTDLSRLPLIDRQQLRAAGTDGRLDARYASRPLRQLVTSGSTGEPLVLRLDRRSLRRRQWRFLRALHASGYRPGRSLMLVSSRSSQSVKRVSKLGMLMRWHYVDLYDGEEKMRAAFRRIRPYVLYAPQNALLTLMHAAGGGKSDHSPRVLVSTSERLTASARAQLRAHFGTDVTDFYGLTELGLIAWRPAGASSYDCAVDDVYLEYLSAARGVDGLQLVVTDLRGGSMPLYRYATGDLVRTQQDRLVELEGKELDSLLMPDGRRIAPYLVDEALTRIEGLVRYRIVQNPDLSIEASIDAPAPDAVARACSALNALVGGCVPVRPTSGAFAPAAQTHKLRPIVSLARPPT